MGALWDTRLMAKRPRDPNQLAKLMVDIATGQVEDTISESKKHPELMRGRLGGLRGGVVRATKLTPKRRHQIAKRAAMTRWK